MTKLCPASRCAHSCVAPLGGNWFVAVASDVDLFVLRKKCVLTPRPCPVRVRALDCAPVQVAVGPLVVATVHPSSSWLVLAGATVGASWAVHRRHRGAAVKLRLREYLTCKSSSWVGALKFSGLCPGFLHCFVTGTQRQEVRDQWAYPTPRCTGSQGPTTSIHPFTTSPGQRALARKNGLTEPGPSDCRVRGQNWTKTVQFALDAPCFVHRTTQQT